MKSCVSIHTLSWVKMPSLKCVLTRALLRGDAPNVANIEFRKPEVAIRPDRDALRQAALCGDGELGEAATGGDTPDLVPGPLGEPQVAIRPGGDLLGLAAIRGPTVLLW